MKKQKKFRSGRSEPKPGNNKPVRMIFIIIFTFGLLGVSWVWKENLNDRLGTHLLSLEKQHRELWVKSSALRAELSDLTNFTNIELAAKNFLGMIPPRVPPDTVWYPGSEEPVIFGASMFYTFRERGKK